MKEVKVWRRGRRKVEEENNERERRGKQVVGRDETKKTKGMVNICDKKGREERMYGGER